MLGYPLTRKEIDRIERLKRRAHHLQNRIDEKPRGYDMSYDKAELSAICWSVEKITGKPFSTIRAQSTGEG